MAELVNRPEYLRQLIQKSSPVSADAANHPCWNCTISIFWNRASRNLTLFI